MKRIDELEAPSKPPKVEEYHTIVDKKDRPLRTEVRQRGDKGRKYHDELMKKGEFFRITYVFFVDIKHRRILLQKRSKEVSNPLTLCPTVSGHVKAGESYAHAAITEAREEIGVHLKEKDLIPLQYIRGSKKRLHPFYRVYMVLWDGKKDQFKTCPHEVHSLLSISKTKIHKLFHRKKGKPVTSKKFKLMWDRYCEKSLTRAIKKQRRLVK